MNSVIGIGLLLALLLTQGCSSSQVKSQQGLKQEQNSLNGENKDDKAKSLDNQQNKLQPSTVAKLTIPKEVKSTSSVPLAVDIQDKAKTASNSDPSQNSNQQMHLVVVSDDLRFFQHEIPNYKGNGRFEVNPDFPAPGNYTVFSDYSEGNNKEVTAQKIKIPGNVPLPTELEKFSNIKILPDTKVTLKLPESTLKSGKQVKLSFNLQDVKNNQSVTDLQPYLNQKDLNQKARLVIVRSSSPLTVADYIPVRVAPDSPNSQVSFTSSFPQKGTYKLWLQFNRNGKVNTADFWVNVV